MQKPGSLSKQHFEELKTQHLTALFHYRMDLQKLRTELNSLEWDENDPHHSYCQLIELKHYIESYFAQTVALQKKQTAKRSKIEKNNH